MRLEESLWIVPPECGGQIVEVSYAWHDGSLYRRCLDQSDRSVTYQVADEDEAAGLPEGWDAANGEPEIPDDAWEEVRS